MLVWLAPIFVFGIVVFVHELGHFLAAKAFGVYAPRFSIGFGPAIAHWRYGETEYRVGILPLGGYVRMASRLDEAAATLEGGGESGPPPDDEKFDPNAMVPFGPKPVPEDRWFESKSLGARLAIMVAGVTMNVLLGWVINVALVKGYAHDLTPRVSQVVAGRPAAAAGMQVGDSIVSVNGAHVTEWGDFVDSVSAHAGTPVRVGLVRHGAPVSITLTPSPDTAADPATGKPVKVGRVGVAATVDSSPIPLGRALREGTHATVGMATLVFTSLRELATRQASVSDLAGPVGIAQASVQAARQGWDVILFLVALLSVNLAVFNLLPIPILDGGQIVVQVVEAVRGEPLTDHAREVVARIGLAFILLLFLTVTFNDLKRLIVGAAGGHPG
jgi:regulator of sigma E protease